MMRRDEAGQSSVELALLLPFMLVLLGVVVQLGLLAATQVAVAAAAHEAAHVAMRTANPARIAAAAGPGDDVTVQTERGRVRDAPVRVRVTRAVAVGVRLPGGLWPGVVHVHADAVTTIETP